MFHFQIQGFAYGIMSILALLAHDCQIPMRQSKIAYLIYIIFFRVKGKSPERQKKKHKQRLNLVGC